MLGDVHWSIDTIQSLTLFRSCPQMVVILWSTQYSLTIFMFRNYGNWFLLSVHIGIKNNTITSPKNSCKLIYFYTSY